MGWALDVDFTLGAWELDRVIFIFHFFRLYLERVESTRENLAPRVQWSSKFRIVQNKEKDCKNGQIFGRADHAGHI